ncbi:MAG: FeoA family protein [Oscillospiraceae bacterium]|nr:FeoA family protein [Oscillospiraceae bacterium]
MTLAQIKPGHGGIITKIGGEGALRRHLLDMGLTPNTRVLVRKVAPMGDPIELYLRGYVLTLRAQDAEKIDVAEIREA